MGNTSDSFPAADVEKELNPGNNTAVEVDSVSSQIAENKEVGYYCCHVIQIIHAR